jgi:hypothetical protein
MLKSDACSINSDSPMEFCVTKPPRLTLN